MYLCIRCIGSASFYDFDVWVRIVPTVWFVFVFNDKNEYYGIYIFLDHFKDISIENECHLNLKRPIYSNLTP